MPAPKVFIINIVIFFMLKIFPLYILTDKLSGLLAKGYFRFQIKTKIH